MLFWVPYPVSIKWSILGTTTAGDTAATTDPRMAASRTEICSRVGANNTIPTISKQAGTKHIRMAGRPTFFKSSRFSESPARVRMMMRANWRRSAEIPKMELSNRLST